MIADQNNLARAVATPLASFFAGAGRIASNRTVQKYAMLNRHSNTDGF